jgi:hypothetical protein
MNINIQHGLMDLGPQYSKVRIQTLFNLYVDPMVGIGQIILYSDSPRLVHWLLCNDNLFLALKGQYKFLKHAKSVHV